MSEQFTPDELANLLGHLAGEWAILAITPAEIAALRTLGYVEPDSARLTEAGRAKLDEVKTCST